MMGGAAIVTGADEATAFLNPAGITRIPGRSFSFSTFALSFGRRTIRGPLDPRKSLSIEDPHLAKTKLRILPNTFCLFLDGPPKNNYSGRSRHKYALCAASSEREVLSFTRAAQHSADGSVSGIGHSTDIEFVRSGVVLSWGLELSRFTSIGVTFRTDNTRLKDSTAATAYMAGSSGADLQTISMARDAWSWDTSVLIGMTSSLSRTVTLGASLSPPSQHLFGSFSGVGTVSSTARGLDRTTQDDGDFRYNQPGSLRLGLAFNWPRLLIEVNGSFYGPQSQRARANFDRRVVLASSDSENVLSEQRDSVVARGAPVTNLAVGMEYFLRQDVSLVAGMNTDFSGQVKLRDTLMQDVLFRQRKDSAHASVGMTSYGARGSLLIGGRASYSWGEVLIADPAAEVPIFVALPQREWALSLVISGRINFRTVREAARRAAAPLQRPKRDPSDVPTSEEDKR